MQFIIVLKLNFTTLAVSTSNTGGEGGGGQVFQC